MLKVDYSVFTKALNYLISDWLTGKIGSGAPTEPWEIEAVKKVNKLNHVTHSGSKVELSADEQFVYDHLVQIKVLGHLRIVTSHRKWIRGTLEILKTIGIHVSVALDTLVLRHDLSKFSHKEVLGYAIMFGDGSIDFRQLENSDDKFEWENSLYNHYAHNPHHPEYFYPLQADGARVRDRSIMELDPVQGKDFLFESAVDMLAANGERLLAQDPVIGVKKWFNLSDRFYKRYEVGDGEFVRDEIQHWEMVAREFLAVEGNQKKLHGIFDERDIVYS